MKSSTSHSFSALSLLLLVTMYPFAAAQQDIGEVLRPALVTPEILESKIAETDTTGDLPGEIKTKLVELYRKSLSNLQEASANAERQQEAEQAKAEVEEMRLETEGSDPILIRLADRNAELTDDLNAMATRLDELHRERAQAQKLAERVRADYEDAESALESSGRSEGLGEVLVAHRDSLPDARFYAAKAVAREHEINAAVVRRLRHREESRRTVDADQTFTDLEAYQSGWRHFLCWATCTRSLLFHSCTSTPCG